MKKVNIESKLLPLLSTGIDAAKTGKELADLLGWSEPEIRKEINRLRKAGVPVCTSTYGFKGYYLPNSTAQAVAFGKQFRNRLADAQKACDVFDQFFDVEDGDNEKQNSPTA